jgi:hypothetical protein
MAGRTVAKHWRVYIDGYDMSGHTLSAGPLSWEYGSDRQATLADAIKGSWPGQARIGIGTLNGVFDNTATSGLHVVASSPAKRVVLVTGGDRAAPAQGDPAFMGEFEQLSYEGVVGGDGLVTATLPFNATSVAAATLAYSKPWGPLLHASVATTAVNTAIGVDDGYGGSTTNGGFMCYQVIAGNGTATITVQDAATNTNGNFAALSGATSGELNMSSVRSGIVAIAVGATVRRFLRWQIAFNSANTVTFALAFVRGQG